MIANIILAFTMAQSDQGEARAYCPSRLIAACNCDYQVSQGARRNELRSTPRMWDQMDGEIAGDPDTKSDARGCTPTGIKHSPLPSEVRPLQGGRHSHNGLCMCLNFARPPVGPNLTAHCACAARPASSEFRHDLEPHAAVSGSARQTLPWARKGQDSRVISTSEFPDMLDSLHGPHETSQYKLRRTPAISFGLRGPYHRTTWSVLLSRDAAAHSHS